MIKTSLPAAGTIVLALACGAAFADMEWDADGDGMLDESEFGVAEEDFGDGGIFDM